MTGREPGAGYDQAIAKVAAGAQARLAAAIVGGAAGLATTALAFRLLSAPGYGVLAFGLSVTTIVARVGRLGLGVGTVRTIAAHDEAGDRQGIRDTVHGAMAAALAAGLVGAAGVLLLLRLVPLGVDPATRTAVGLALGALLLGTNVVWVGGSTARALGSVVLTELQALPPVLGRLAVVAGLAAVGLSDVGAVAIGWGTVGVVSGVASATIARILLRRERGVTGGLRRLGHRLRKSLGAGMRLARVSWPYALPALAAVAIARFDVFVLGLSRGVQAVGSYEPALRLVERLVEIVPLLLLAQYLPSVTRLFERGDHGAIREIYATVTKLTYVAVFPAVLALTGFPETILGAVYGSGLAVRPGTVWLLVGGFVTVLVLGYSHATLAAAGDRRRLAIVGAATLAAMVALALALIPPFGIVGAAAATAGGYAVREGATAWALRSGHGVRLERPDLVLTLLTSGVPLGAVVVVRSFASVSSIWAATGWSLGLWAAWVGLLAAGGAISRGELRPFWTLGRSRVASPGGGEART